MDYQSIHHQKKRTQLSSNSSFSVSSCHNSVIRQPPPPPPLPQHPIAPTPVSPAKNALSLGIASVNIIKTKFKITITSDLPVAKLVLFPLNPHITRHEKPYMDTPQHNHGACEFWVLGFVWFGVFFWGGGGCFFVLFLWGGGGGVLFLMGWGGGRRGGVKTRNSVQSSFPSHKGRSDRKHTLHAKLAFVTFPLWGCALNVEDTKGKWRRISAKSSGCGLNWKTSQTHECIWDGDYSAFRRVIVRSGLAIHV